MADDIKEHFSLPGYKSNKQTRDFQEENESTALNRRLAELEKEVATLKQENEILQSKVKELTKNLDETIQERDIYHYVLMNIPSGVLIMVGPEHVFNFANPAYLQIANRDDSTIGCKVRQVFPEIENQGLFELLDEVYKTGNPFIANELPVMIDVTGKGDLVEIYYDFIYYPILNKEGKVQGIFDFTTDVTERVKARKSLEHERHRLQEIFEEAPASIAVLSGPNHVYELVNEPYMQLIGRKQSIIGQTVAETLPEIIDQGFIDILDEVYRTNVPYVGKEMKFLVDRKGNGEMENAYVNFVYQPMLSQDGSGVESIFAHILDITEQVQSRQQVEELSHLKDEFLAIASHDLRTPVTSIKGYVQLLQRNFVKQYNFVETKNSASEAGNSLDQASIRRFLETNLKIIGTVLNQTNRINELIARFLDYSRITQDQIKLQYTQNADLVKLVMAVVANLGMTSHDHRILLANNVDTLSRIDVNFDEARLEQVFNNLIGNAIKYSPAGTNITVGIEPPMPGAAEVVIWVKDEGYGISQDEQSHIFERFYRIQNDHNANKGGLGLGLYISAQIIKLHGGRLWLESQKDVGSTFFVVLPTN